MGVASFGIFRFSLRRQQLCLGKISYQTEIYFLAFKCFQDEQFFKIRSWVAICQLLLAATLKE